MVNPELTQNLMVQHYQKFNIQMDTRSVVYLYNETLSSKKKKEKKEIACNINKL